MNTQTSLSIINPYGKSDTCASFNIDDVSVPFTLSDIVNIGQEYTFCFWVRSTNSASIKVEGSVYSTSSAWTRYKKTFTATSRHIQIFFGANGTYNIYHPKLETGNRDTDWTAAPEDAENRLSEAENDIQKTEDQLSADIQATKEQLTADLNSAKQELSNELNTTRERLTNDIQITQRGLTASMEAVSEDLTSIEEEITTLKATAEGLKVDVSSKVTQQDIDESIAGIDEFHNTTVDIVSDGISINTSGSIRAMVDDIERLVIDEDGVSAPLIVANDVRSPVLLRKHSGSTATWRGSIQASINELPKYLGQNVTLTVPAGVYSEDVTIAGFMGATLIILLSSGVEINGTISIANCANVMLKANSLGDASIYPKSGGWSVVSINACHIVSISGLYISGYRSRTASVAGTTIGVEAYDSNVKLTNCCIEYTSSYAYYHDLGTFYISNVIGGQNSTSASTNANLGYSIRAFNGAHGAAYGRIPMATNSYGASTATLITSSVAPTAGGMTYVAPTEITKTFAITKHCTYVSNNKRITDGATTLLSQGRYGTYSTNTHYTDWRTGAIWFGGATSELSSKTIVSAKLTIRRASGGSSKAVDVCLGTVDLTEANYESTTNPTFTKASKYPIGTLARETEAIYDVTDLMSAVKAGKAIGVSEMPDDYSGSYSPEYTPFYGKGSAYEPVLTVTYK